MHGGCMDRQPTQKWASVGKLIAAHEFCLWLDGPDKPIAFDCIRVHSWFGVELFGSGYAWCVSSCMLACAAL